MRLHDRTISLFACGLLATATMSCGPKSNSAQVIPMLPGDGDAHTAKPMAPPDKATDTTDPWARRTDLIQPPSANSAASVALPPVERFTLRNGLRVIVVADPTLPIVGMQLAVVAGRGDASRDQMGIAEFAAAMLSKGTQKRDALAIASEIDFVGGSLVGSAGLEATTVTCSVMSKDLGTCLSLLPDVVANSQFPEAEMAEIRNRLHAEVRTRRDDAGEMASAHFQNALWGDEHVRGWPMSARTIENITRNDLKAWHKTWFVPANAILAIAGDVDAAAMRKSLDRAFATWRKNKPGKRASYVAPELQGISVRLVNKPGQTQSHIRLGHYGIAHASPDFFPMLVFNYSLGGGGFSSRLLTVVRVQGGKAYGAHSGFDRNRDRGAFIASTFTRSAETVATVKLILGEIEKMAAEGPSEQEVSDAIKNIAGQYSTRFESASSIASALLGAALHDMTEEYVQDYALRASAVTADQAKSAAGKYLDPRNLVVVIVGDAAIVGPQLAAAGIAFEKIENADPIASYERQPVAPDQAVDPKSLAAGAKLLDAAIKAKGGLAKLSAMKSLVMNASAELEMGGQNAPATFVRTFVSPDKVRLDTSIMGGAITAETVRNGAVAWIKQAQGDQVNTIEVTGSELDLLKAQHWRDIDFILQRAKIDTAVVSALADESVEGTDYHVLNIALKDNSVSVRVYLDKKTSLIARMTYAQQGVTSVERYSDYKVIDGIAIAHKRTTTNPQVSISAVVDNVVINSTVRDELFQKPTK